MTKKIRIMVADDHTLFREGLSMILAAQPDMELTGEAGDGVEAVLLCRAVQPDVILLDLKMPRRDGLAAIPEIRQASPRTRILVLTSFADDERVYPAVQAGALGYLLKDAPRDQLLQAIHEVAGGRPYLHPGIAFKALREFGEPNTAETLTEREVATLRLIARGLPNHEIARELKIADHTVGKYVSSILLKLRLSNRTQAALYALRHQIASLDDVWGEG